MSPATPQALVLLTQQVLDALAQPEPDWRTITQTLAERATLIEAMQASPPADAAAQDTWRHLQLIDRELGHALAKHREALGAALRDVQQQRQQLRQFSTGPSTDLAGADRLA